MKKLFILLAALFCAAVYAATIDIVAAEDRNYKIGEEITFKVTAYESKDKLMSAGTFTLKITDSGLRAISVKADLSKGNPFTFKTKLDRAGFVFVKPTDYTLPDGKKGKWANTRDLPAAGEPRSNLKKSDRQAVFLRISTNSGLTGLKSLKKLKFQLSVRLNWIIQTTKFPV